MSFFLPITKAERERASGAFRKKSLLNHHLQAFLFPPLLFFDRDNAR